VIRKPGGVLGDEQVVGVPDAKHLDPHQSRSDHQCVNAIHPYRVKRMKPNQRRAALVAKSHVMTDLIDSTARLDPANHITMSPVLVFQADGRVCVNPDFGQRPQCTPWKGQSLASFVASLGASCHTYLLTVN
jgi:hypothetical protein